MTRPADLPTVRVLLRGPVDLIRQSTGRAIRVEALFDADVPHDINGVVKPFARFRRHNEQTPASFISFGDALLTERPELWETNSWHGYYFARLQAISSHIFSPYEYLREVGPGVPHLTTGGFDFSTPDQKIFALAGQAVAAGGLGGDVDEGQLHAQISRMRAEAAAAILLTPEGFFVPRQMPRWEIRQDFHHLDLAVLELVDHSPRSEEWSFRLDRFELASQALREAPFLNKAVAGELLHWDAELAPMLEDDVVRLARARAPHLTGWRGVSPDLLESRLVPDWHDLRNAPRILSEEGRPGADRILQSALRMLDHRMGFESGGFAWQRLRERILMEGIELPAPAQGLEVRP